MDHHKINYEEMSVIIENPMVAIFLFLLLIFIFIVILDNLSTSYIINCICNQK